jgi:hypothetical protein
MMKFFYFFGKAQVSRRLNITGYPIEDFIIVLPQILPDKGDLIQELRNELKRTGSKDAHFIVLLSSWFLS